LTAAEAVSAQALEPADSEASLAQSASLPGWVVPVLRLVSATHVEPTTGIVLSTSGRVLVPAPFADAGDEVIVLDGGTDIVRNGRPARIERTFAQAGVEVLWVEGLRRPAVSLAKGLPADGASVTLAAFPPAEQISEGMPPLSVTASVSVLRESGRPAISRETPLPHVTGPLVDDCGDLVGVSLVDDVQTMEPSSATRYAWTPALTRLFTTLGIEPAPSRCPPAIAAVEPEPQPDPPPTDEPPAVEPPDETPAEPEAPEPEQAGEEPVTVAVAEPEPETLDIDILPPIETGESSAGAPREEAPPRRWVWLLAAALLFGLGILLHRLRQSQPVRSEAGDQGAPEPPAVAGPGGAPDDLSQPSALDHVLTLRGVLPDGSEFEVSCPVSEQAINVTIGRGEADLTIDSAAVSRRHASLNGGRGELTLTDLGSSNGTSINGVPVLEGEIMFLEAGDSVVLGNVRCRFEVRPADAEPGD
jgi:hypothetical protein